MFCTKKEFEEMILSVADRVDSVNGRRSYTELLKQKSLPEIVKYIGYDIFVKDLNQFSDNDIFVAILSIRQYANKLAETGIIDFKKP